MGEKEYANGCSILEQSDFERDLLTHIQSLRKFGIGLTRSTTSADDLVQDTLLRALSKKDQFKPGTNLRAWLFTIMRNRWHSLHRKQRWERPFYDDEEHRAPAHCSVRAFEQAEEVMHRFINLAPYLAQLSGDMRDALICNYYLDLPLEDAAHILDIKIGTVKSRLNRAIERLHHLMQTECVEPFDISVWASATQEISRSHRYYPVAKAYEDIYTFISENTQ
jgi:RNA polymerase sigma-70 factor (ECF subfamily)